MGQPEALRRVDELKQSLLGTDRDDHWQEVLDMEKDVKAELLKNDLSKHKGMQLLLDWMIDRIKEISELLMISKSKDLTDSQRDGLIEVREFITTLVDFLDPKGKRLKELEKELEYQLADPGDIEDDL